jgi:predicted  nucleic acid-binding Zn-ribbon protein
MTCENLATKAELAALENKLTALLTAKLDKSERQGIIDIATSGAVGIVGATLIPPVKAEASAAKSLAEVARTKAFNAGDIATRAADIAAVSRDVASGAAQSATVARQAATVAQTEARAASALARLAQSTANVAKGAAEAAGKLASFVNGKIDGAIGKFTNLFNALDGKLGGLLSKFGALAGKVFQLLSVVSTILSIITTLATIYQLTNLTIRVGAIERQMSLINSELDRIQNLALRILEQVRAVEKNLSAKASEALAKAIAAFNLGFNALSNSLRAQETAGKALKNSIEAAKNAAIASAVATAASLAVGAIASRIAGISSIANSANAKADEALRRAGKGGTTYIDRTVTNNYTTQQTLIQRYEGKDGKPGKDGVNGLNGKDGKDGKDVNPADLGEIKRLLYKIDGTTVKTDGVTTANLAVSTTTNTKVGIIGGTLDKLNEFTQKAFKATRLDKVLNALNFILLLHNAAMLSRNLASTLGDLTSQALAVIGIKDEQNNPIDINSILSKQADSFMSGILGEEIWKGTKESWNKANRIISSATNIVWTIRSLGDSAREIAEWTAENTGKIGNALKRYRIVGEDAYKWMPENVKSTNKWTRAVDRFTEGTASLDDAASSLSGVLSEVQNVGEEFGQLKEQRDTFKKQLEDLEPKEQKDNVPVKTTADARKEASVNPPEIANVERGQGEAVTSGT